MTNLELADELEELLTAKESPIRKAVIANTMIDNGDAILAALRAPDTDASHQCPDCRCVAARGQS